jgi:predicted histone-like DNA-binding protein
MAIQFVRVKRNIIFGPNPGEKFIARIVREQSVDLDYIAEQVAGASTMSKADVMGVLQQLQVEMSYHLTRGASVRLGLLGTFTPYLRSKSQLEVDLVKASTFKGLHITFRPSPWLNTKIKGASFKLIDPNIKGLIEVSRTNENETNTESTDTATMDALLKKRETQEKSEKSKK